MPKPPDPSTDCEICGRHTDVEGPWCELYCKKAQKLCWNQLHASLAVADRTGDGPMVNALCAYGRKHYGQCLHW